MPLFQKNQVFCRKFRKVTAAAVNSKISMMTCFSKSAAPYPIFFTVSVLWIIVYDVSFWMSVPLNRLCGDGHFSAFHKNVRITCPIIRQSFLTLRP